MMVVMIVMNNNGLSSSLILSSNLTPKTADFSVLEASKFQTSNTTVTFDFRLTGHCSFSGDTSR